MRTRGTALAVSLSIIATAAITAAITRAPSPLFDKLLWSLEGDRMVSLHEPGIPDGDYRVPVGTRCRLYRLFLNRNVIQVEDGRLSYDTDVFLLDDCPANRKFTDPKSK